MLNFLQQSVDLDQQQPLSLQDEINMSEQQEYEEQEHRASGTSQFRQIFDKIFALLQTTHANESVT